MDLETGYVYEPNVESEGMAFHFLGYSDNELQLILQFSDGEVIKYPKGSLELILNKYYHRLDEKQSLVWKLKNAGS